MKKILIAGMMISALSVGSIGCKKKTPVAAVPKPPAPVQQDAKPAPAATSSRPAPVERRETAAAPTSRMPDAATKARIQDLLDKIQDAYFDYDKHSIRPDAETALKADVKTLSDIIRQYPDYKLTVEGHADERGSDEYNVALGEARAKKALEYMASLGLPANQLKTVSYGKQKPICTEPTEDCYQKNRRAHITQAQ